VVAVGAAHGTPHTPFFEGCSPSPFAPSYAPAAAVDVPSAEDVGAASAGAKRRSSKGKGGRGGGGGSRSCGGGSSGGGGRSGGGGSGGSGGGSGGFGGSVGGSGGSGGGGSGGSGGGRTGAQRGGSRGGQRQRQQHRSNTPSPQQFRECLFQRGASGGSVSCPYVVHMSDRAGQTCGKPHTQHRCFSHLDDAWRAEFGGELERPHWAKLLSIEVAALDASESSLLATAPAEALHTFTLDSGASRCFFHDSTTLSPHPAPVPVRLADPSGGPVVARSSTVLSCPAVPSSSLSGLHLPLFATNLVTTAALQDSMVTTTTPGGQVAPPCLCRLLSHQTLLWHHRLGHPSLPRLGGMHSRLLVSGLPRSLPPLLPSPAPPCLPCVEGQQRAAPHSSSFPPTTSPLQTLHMDLHERFRQDLLVLRLHSDRGGEFSSDLLRNFCRGEGILQSFTLLASPQQNGIAERRIGLVMEVARTSMIHAAALHFLWPFAVRYASHQLNLRPRGSHAFVRDLSADKLSARAIPCVFLGFPPNAPGWQFYHPTLRRVFPSRDVMFDEPLATQVLLAVLRLGAEPRGAESEGAGSGGAEPGGAEPRGAEREGVEPGGAEFEGAESGGAEPRATGDTGAGGAGVTTGAGGTGGAAGAGPGGARIRGNGAAGTGGVGGAGAGDPTEPGAAGAEGTGAGGAGAGGPGTSGAGAGGAGDVDPRAGGAGPRGAGGTGARGAVRPRPNFVPLLQQFGDLTERRELASRPVSPVRTARRVPRSRPPPVPGTHAMALRRSSVPLRVPLPPRLESSLPAVPDPGSDLARAASPTISCLLTSVVSDPTFESTAASALVAELLYFVVAGRLDFAIALVAESASASPPSVGGECALSTDVLEDKQEEFECLADAAPRFASMLLAPEGDPDAPDIPTPRSYAEAITGPYSSKWQATMVAEMASWKSTGTYIDAVPSSRVNIVDGMLIFRRDYELHSLDFKTAFLQGSLHEEIRLRRPPGFTGSFPAGTQWSLRRPVYGLRQVPREWHDTLRTTFAALGFAPSTANPSLFLRTDTSLSPFYVLVYVNDLVFSTADTEALTLVKSELQKRHTCTDLGEVLQCFSFHLSSAQPTPLSTGYSLSAPPSDESIEPSGIYPELVGFLMYVVTCTRPDLAYPLSLLARNVAPGRHQKVHWDAAKRVLRYLCGTSGMGLVLGGRGLVFLTSDTDASWVNDSATQRSSEGYTFSLGSGSVSWWSTRSSSVLSSSCEAEIYAGAMAAQELRWLTYLLTDLGEQPRSPPQHGQLRLAYVATRANTADIFTKALPPACFAFLIGLVTTCSPPLCLCDHPGEPPPLPPRPGPPPPEPNLTVAATPELQAAADATFLHNRREYLICKADHDVAVLNHEFASSEHATRMELIAEYNNSMAAYVPNSIAWAAANNHACTILPGALRDALMHRFQACEMRAHLIWTEL
ncbi:unnamed protein product, partial [Closterium sp. NIES-53]